MMKRKSEGSSQLPCVLQYSNRAGHRSLCIADASIAELYCSSCVQADHDDADHDLVREAKFLQHLEESLARDGVEGFDVKSMKSARVSRLCSLRFSSAILVLKSRRDLEIPICVHSWGGSEVLYYGGTPK